MPLVDRDLVREFSPRVSRGKQVYGTRAWVLISRRKLTGFGWLTVRGVRENLAPFPCKPWGLLNPLGGGPRENCGDSFGGNAPDAILEQMNTIRSIEIIAVKVKASIS